MGASDLDARRQRIVSLLVAGRLADAEAACLDILNQHPGDFDALHHLGIVAAQTGRLDRAAGFLSRAIEAAPRNAEAFSNRAYVLHELGRYEDSLADCDTAIALRPTFAEAHNNRGNALLSLKRDAEALASCDRALVLKPDYPEAYLNGGNALHNLGRHEEGLVNYDRALQLHPDYPEALINRSLVWRSLNRFEQALADCERALALDGGQATTRQALGEILRRLGRREEAVASFNAALALQPDYAEALSSRGLTLMELGRFDEALQSVEAALTLTPDFVDALNNRGFIHHATNRIEMALASYEEALTLSPTSPDALCNRGFLRLLLDDYAGGFPGYELRLRAPGATPLDVSQPQWTGEQALAGKTIYVHWEQGLGDTIHFSRYVSLLEQRGARVVFAVQDSIRRLMQTLSPTVEIVGSTVVPDRFDFHSPLMSLPMAFGTEISSIPAAVPYLAAEPERAERWRERLGKTGFKVGIAWQGRRNVRSDLGRSFPLSLFEPLAAIPGVRLISLQKNDGAEQLVALPPGMTIETLGENFDAGPDAFLDAAAVMTALDLVITVDTSLAHLAGALGRPCWVALAKVPDWRWGLQRTDSPWYPSLRLFRQEEAGDWAGVLKRIEAALREEAGAR